MKPKFRAWDKKCNEMFKDTFAITESGQVIIVEQESVFDTPDYVFTDDLIIMQSTGLIDKNGKEVFENDVIRDSDGFEGIVQYDESYGVYGIAYLPTLSNGIDMTFEELKDNYRNKFEVIGNIYENSELLEEEE
ncbi:YopX family protein [Streptococcus gallolyticus]|uniref:YopX family protein n=1 Tax=Streptococcus gallolyticus TaxID=315405 RepID=UPI003D2FB677